MLAAAGHRVVGVDYSDKAVAEARGRAPGCEFHVQDLRSPFPASAAHVKVAVASLSLHYFEWEQTLEIVRRIHQVLPVGGLLLCRLNSTQDHHYGASGHTEIAENYYQVNGEPKRFFDRAAVESLFAKGWHIAQIEHHVVNRYTMPKALWEAAVERAA